MSDEIFVSGKTPTGKLGAAIAHRLREQGIAVIRACGVQAVSQATKGVAVAKEYLADRDRRRLSIDDLTMERADFDGEERTIIQYKLSVE